MIKIPPLKRKRQKIFKQIKQIKWRWPRRLITGKRKKTMDFNILGDVPENTKPGMNVLNLATILGPLAPPWGLMANSDGYPMLIAMNMDHDSLIEAIKNHQEPPYEEIATFTGDLVQAWANALDSYEKLSQHANLDEKSQVATIKLTVAVAALRSADDLINPHDCGDPNCEVYPVQKIVRAALQTLDGLKESTEFWHALSYRMSIAHMGKEKFGEILAEGQFEESPEELIEMIDKDLWEQVKEPQSDIGEYIKSKFEPKADEE